jgi:hypothetical protein
MKKLLHSLGFSNWEKSGARSRQALAADSE